MYVRLVTAASRRTGLPVLVAVVGLAIGCNTVSPVPTASPMAPSPAASSTAVAATPSANPPTPSAQATPTVAPSPSASPTASATTPATSNPTVEPSGTPHGPTVAPSLEPTPTAFAGLVLDPADIERHLDALMAVAEANDGIRAGGTSGYDASAEYVAAELAAMGYAVDRNPVDFTYFNEAAPVELVVGEDSWTGAEWIHANLYSGEGNVTAVAETVAIVNGQPTQTAGCDPNDWNDFEPGKIAMVMPGGCFSRDKVLQAQDAGALALISLVATWNDPGEVLRPTLLQPEVIDIPAVVVGLDPIDELLAAAEAGGTVELNVDTIETPANDDNVIGELQGQTDEVLFLGGHLDSVLDGPGINDNASGVATLLALAEALSGGPQPRQTIRFGFWAAEEFGTLGSSSYVAGLSGADVDRIYAYLNLDMVGSVNAARFVYDGFGNEPGGVADQLTDQLLAAFENMGAPALPADLGGGSDHVHFDLRGIPTGGVFSGLSPLTPAEAETFGGVAGAPADPCYHLPCDGRANVDVDTALLFGTAIAAVVEELAL